ncbi:MAG: MoaD/ThiS family protein [Thermaceae bacterium]|nr:MoaD/ThiS family protein [Thermaceae bacterium]
MIRVVLPYHLRNLARVSGEVSLELPTPATLAAVLRALEARFPALRGTVIDPASNQRRALLRFFVCGEDWSHLGLDIPLPDMVLGGAEPLLIVGAISGG